MKTKSRLSKQNLLNCSSYSHLSRVRKFLTASFGKASSFTRKMQINIFRKCLCCTLTLLACNIYVNANPVLHSVKQIPLLIEDFILNKIISYNQQEYEEKKTIFPSEYLSEKKLKFHLIDTISSFEYGFSSLYVCEFDVNGDEISIIYYNIDKDTIVINTKYIFISRIIYCCKDTPIDILKPQQCATTEKEMRRIAPKIQCKKYGPTLVKLA